MNKYHLNQAIHQSRIKPLILLCYFKKETEKYSIDIFSRYENSNKCKNHLSYQ